MLKKWSVTRKPNSPNCNQFIEEPTISLKQWTEGYQWAAANHKVIREEKSSPVYYVCSSTHGEPITPEIVEEYQEKEGEWENFEEFVKLQYGVWKVNVNEGCSCPIYSKFYCCKHWLGMRIRLKMADPPIEAKLIPLGCKRKRGRPSLAKQALIIQ